MPSLSLNLFIYPDGHHEAAWRYPDAETDRPIPIPASTPRSRARAERGHFDSVFLADVPTLGHQRGLGEQPRRRARADHAARLAWPARPSASG